MKQIIKLLMIVVVVSMLSGCSLLSCKSSGRHWKKVWSIDNLPNPESVVFDEKRNVVFVSHQDYSHKTGTGSIGKLSLNGTVIEKEWIKGLDKPKGIALRGNTLFVSDITKLIEIDIEKGIIINKHIIDGASFLNDIAIDRDGNVYVSDMFNSSIYKMSKMNKVELWLHTPEIENPNGLLIIGNKMLVGAWGKFSNKKPLEAPAGNFLEVDMKNKNIKKLTNVALGNLDGVQRYSRDKYIVSDWVSGDIYISDKRNKFSRILDLEQSTGDIAYIPSNRLLLVPMAKQGKVMAFKEIDTNK